MRLRKLNYCIDKQILISNFSVWILNIGNGTTNRIKDIENKDARWIKIPEKYIISYNTESIKCTSTTINKIFF